MDKVNKPFFSVVIPVFNKELYIQKTIQSVLDQTFKNFELILVIDPCTDRTVDIVKSFNDERIHILNRETPGPGGYAARNLGIKMAKADWIAFQDADDIWYPHHLQTLHDGIITMTDLNVFATGYETLIGNIRKPNSFWKRFNRNGDAIIELNNFLLYRPICSINVAVKKSIFNLAGDFPAGRVNRGGDHETWLRIMTVEKKMYWLNTITAVYNKNAEGSVTKSINYYTENHPIRLKVLELLDNDAFIDLALELKRHSNNFIIPGIKNKIKNGSLNKSDVSALFWDAYQNKIELYFFYFFSLLPHAFQIFFSKVFKN
ncbi:MAG: glycosyltransferase family 2 protein [Chitinophagaceae bacterium]